MARAGLVGVLVRRDRRDEALDLVRDIERRTAGGQLACSAAWANALIGELDEAFRWIDRAIAAREPFVACLPTFCWWDPLRDDPRFGELLRRLKFPEWSIAVSAERARRRTATPPSSGLK
jgi:hypothetical protein